VALALVPLLLLRALPLAGIEEQLLRGATPASMAIVFIVVSSSWRPADAPAPTSQKRKVAPTIGPLISTSQTKPSFS